MRSRLGAVSAILAALVACLTVVVPTAATARQATGSITLEGQTPFRVPGQPFAATIRVRTSSATSGLEIAVGTYRRMRSRSEFANAVDGRLPARTPTDLVRTPLDSLTRDAEGNVSVAIEPRATQEGVYPVRIELREVDGGNVVDGFTTFLISLPAVVEADPLDVAVVLPVHAPPAVKPDGAVDVDDDRADALAEMAAVLSTRSTVPLTITPTPETLEALAGSATAADRDAASALARASSGREVVASSYVPTDVTALLGADLGGELNAQLDRGAKVTGEILGGPISRNVRIVDERLSSEAMTTIESHGVERLVVPEALLDPIRPPNGVTLTATFEVPTSRAAFEAAAADVGLAAHFDRDVPPVLGASQLLADLAVLWLDRPGQAAERRGVVVLPPRGWTPEVTFVDTLVDALTANPILEPVTLETFFAAVGKATTRGDVLQRSFVADGRTAGLNAGALRAARRKLEGFASVLESDNPALDLLDRTLLVSESTELRPTERAAYVRSVTNQIDDQLGAIAMPERRSITLTAREGELPVTVTSELPYPITVVLTLESDTLDFPAGTTKRVTLTHQNTTERFTVHARGSGSFPVRIRVTSPQGGLVIAESRFTVRSTAVSGVGVALSVGAAGFLIVWWASHLHSRRSAARKPATA